MAPNVPPSSWRSDFREDLTELITDLKLAGVRTIFIYLIQRMALVERSIAISTAILLGCGDLFSRQHLKKLEGHLANHTWLDFRLDNLHNYF